MKIKGKGKYNGKKQIELDKELGLPADTEIFFTVEEVKPLDTTLKNRKHNKKTKNKDVEEHALLQIAKLARPVGRSDLSVRHHEILGDVIE